MKRILQLNNGNKTSASDPWMIRLKNKQNAVNQTFYIVKIYIVRFYIVHPHPRCVDTCQTHGKKFHDHCRLKTTGQSEHLSLVMANVRH